MIYLTFPINRRMIGLTANMTTPTPTVNCVIDQKSSGKAFLESSEAPISPATSPAIRFPSAIDMNQRPIIYPTSFLGASFITALIPIGEKLSSPAK
ncbi:MAG: hypothetical protein RIC80_00965 [Cyclobacteriaceae bacterium]